MTHPSEMPYFERVEAERRVDRPRQHSRTAREGHETVPPTYSLSAVLPAHNEERNIRRCVRAVDTTAARLFREHEIIVVDDGSTDGTAAVVEELARRGVPVRLLRHRTNRGYGEALRTGFLAAGNDLVFLTDADNQFDPAELERFLPWIDRTDVVVGFRTNRHDPRLRRVLAWGWNALMRLLFHIPVRDIDCAFKLFRREVFEVVDLTAVGAMVSTELMVKIGRAGLGVVELGVHHYPRTAGRPRGAHPRVIFLALREAASMYAELRGLTGGDLLPGIRPAGILRRGDGEPEGRRPRNAAGGR